MNEINNWEYFQINQILRISNLYVENYIFDVRQNIYFKLLINKFTKRVDFIGGSMLYTGFGNNPPEKKTMRKSSIILFPYFSTSELFA